MKNEAEFCGVIKHSLDNVYKIPDPSSDYASTSLRCFDGVATIKENDKQYFICWEAKFMKAMQAFNFQRIEPHQNYWLNTFNKCENVRSYVILGVSVSRGDNRAYIFEWNDKMGELYNSKFSIHKKQLMSLPYNEIHKSRFEFKNIITYEDLVSKNNM